MPRFLFLKKYMLYISLSLLLLFCAVDIKWQIDKNHFKNFMPRPMNELRSHVENIPRMKPPHEFRKKPPFFGNFFSSFGILLVFAASTSLQFANKWRRDEMARTELEKERSLAELNYLKQQINPHFLLNALNSIYSLTLTKSDLSSEAILKLSSILKYLLYHSENKTVTLQSEIEVIADYIDVQKLRLTKNVTVKFTPEISNGKQLIEPLLFLPLVENAFKHGVDNVNPCAINISIIGKENEVGITVINDIVSKKSTFNQEYSNIGLRNIEKRLEMVYPNRYVLEKSEKDGKFIITLKIKLV